MEEPLSKAERYVNTVLASMGLDCIEEDTLVVLSEDKKECCVTILWCTEGHIIPLVLSPVHPILFSQWNARTLLMELIYEAIELYIDSNNE